MLQLINIYCQWSLERYSCSPCFKARQDSMTCLEQISSGCNGSWDSPHMEAPAGGYLGLDLSKSESCDSPSGTHWLATAWCPMTLEVLQAVWDILTWLADTTQHLWVILVPPKETETRDSILKHLNWTRCLCVVDWRLRLQFSLLCAMT